MNKSILLTLAKLLKEKGFVCAKSDKFWRNGFPCEKKDYNPAVYQNEDNVATIGEVIMWLYEEHDIWIGVRKQPDWNKFYYEIIYKSIPVGTTMTNSPTEAYEAAIEYCLNKLI